MMKLQGYIKSTQWNNKFIPQNCRTRRIITLSNNHSFQRSWDDDKSAFQVTAPTFRHVQLVAITICGFQKCTRLQTLISLSDRKGKFLTNFCCTSLIGHWKFVIEYSSCKLISRYSIENTIKIFRLEDIEGARRRLFC